MIETILTGCWHIGAKGTDIDNLKEIKRKYWEGRPVILMGDLIDMGIEKGMQFDQKINSDDQISELKEVVQGLDVKSALIGNHEERIFKHTGINIFKSVFGWSQKHDIVIGSKHFYVTHGGGNAINPWTEFNKLLFFVDADFICMGHNHFLGKMTILRGNKIVNLIRTGSFLNGARYSKDAALPPRLNGWVTVYPEANYVELNALYEGVVKNI